jgi:3-hydroxyacyl-CoA dehydrogenase/enoyl-CoA hydratase/3-hydroxybutyryl-CoA epimerase
MMRASGFPEVMLVMHPGSAVRCVFTRLGQPMQAMTLDADRQDHRRAQGKSLGLVDAGGAGAGCQECAVKDAVFGPPEARQAGLLNTVLMSAAVRAFLASRMRCEAAKAGAAGALSRAPYAADRSLGEKYGSDKSAMLAAREALRSPNLMVTPTAQNLIRVFFLREQMKKLAGCGNRVAHVSRHRRRRDGRRYRGAWCAGQKPSRDASRHEAGADRRARSSAPPICSARSCASAPRRRDALDA